MDGAKDITSARRQSLRNIGNTEHALQSLLTEDVRLQVATVQQHIAQLHARLNAAIDASGGGGADGERGQLKRIHELMAEYRDIYAKLDERVCEAEQSYRVLRFQFLKQFKSEWINVPAPQSQELAMAIMPWDVAKRGRRRNAAIGAKKKKPRKKRAAKVLDGKIVTKEQITEGRKARIAAKRAPKDPKAPRPTVKRLKVEPEGADVDIKVEKPGEK
jgi:hypothetical protein